MVYLSCPPFHVTTSLLVLLARVKSSFSEVLQLYDYNTDIVSRAPGNRCFNKPPASSHARSLVIAGAERSRKVHRLLIANLIPQTIRCKDQELALLVYKDGPGVRISHDPLLKMSIPNASGHCQGALDSPCSTVIHHETTLKWTVAGM
jgi:hypothetical protein